MGINMFICGGCPACMFLPTVRPGDVIKLDKSILVVGPDDRTTLTYVLFRNSPFGYKEVTKEDVSYVKRLLKYAPDILSRANGPNRGVHEGAMDVFDHYCLTITESEHPVKEK